MQLKLDTIEGAEADISFESSHVVRTGIVTGIPSQTRSDPYTLLRAIYDAGGPTLGAKHPYDDDLRLSRIVARPGSSTNDAIVMYHYEGIVKQAILFVEDDTSLCTEQTSVDLEGYVIQAIYKYPEQTTVAGYPTVRDKEVPHTVTIPYLVPRRQLTVHGIYLGPPAPSAWPRDTVGSVNKNPWPTNLLLWSDDAPKKKGYWLCTHVSSTVDFRNYSGFKKTLQEYKLKASFQSKVTKSWLAVGTFRNAFGNVPSDVGDTAEKAAAIKKVIEGEYSISQNHDVSGIVTVGPYPQAAFSSIFGF